MVKPVRFGFNPQTAANNAFQREGFEEKAQENASREFSAYVSLLRANKIDVVVAEDTEVPYTPDSIFPNNWFSTHEDGTLVLYPMFALNRRNERKSEFLDVIRRNFEVRRLVDLTWWETENLFLEGTGSMILDRENKIAYAGRSPRTNDKVLADFCKQMGYTAVVFDAYDQGGELIYHTNVMMSVGTKFSVICLSAITDLQQRKQVVESLQATGKTIIDISFEQMSSFAGNMLELKNRDGKPILVMSSSARKSLTAEQTKQLSGYYKLLSPGLEYIENNGGGSARCMLAEIY
ncbi:MAG: amidinotransferase [Bacteroidales bacterium]|nr:amidinotransferase [Bacteroidales bacterium]